MKQIIYGGAFNPPTIAHYKIITYLLEKFSDYELIVLPTNSYYNKQELAPFNNRLEMLNILKDKINSDRLIISDLENNDKAYLGTYNTLKVLNHPYFVIGADSLNTLSKWIKGKELIEENTFVIFPRSGFDIEEILSRDVYKDNRDHFIVLDDFENIDISSTLYRRGQSNVVFEEIDKYIKNKNLYK